MIQVVKRGAECWELTRVDEIWKDAHEYEVIGRVVRDGAHYFVDLPVWGAEKLESWARQPRGYLIPRAAFKVVIDGSRREKVVS